MGEAAGTAILYAAAIGVASTWAGIVIAYDSYVWTGGHGWPVSFCIVSIIFVVYLAAAMVSRDGAGRSPGTGQSRKASGS